ncbi:MAG: leucine-rich repeat domain-containing protein [Ruminiclostridium sp.]|nr:leucine-rich repeat domain-containing protein [Ruminiclostridium sp.]
MKKLFKAAAALLTAAALTAALTATASALYIVKFPTQHSTTINPYKAGDNCEWFFDEEQNALFIKGKGKMTDFGNEFAVPWRKYADKIVAAVIEDGITSIGTYSFSYCKNLVSVSIPSTVNRISECAFYHCDALPHALIPASVDHIENMAFGECGLTTLTFEGNPSDISVHAFELVGRVSPCIVYCPDDFSLTWRMKVPHEWYGGYFNFAIERDYWD